MLTNILIGLGVGATVGIMESNINNRINKINEAERRIDRTIKTTNAHLLAQQYYINKALKEKEEKLKRIGVI